MHGMTIAKQIGCKVFSIISSVDVSQAISVQSACRRNGWQTKKRREREENRQKEKKPWGLSDLKACN